MTLVKFHNKPLNNSFNNFMDDFFATVPSILRDDLITPALSSFTPVNIRETENDYVLDVVAPGFQKEDFKINLDNNTLTISADKKEETENRNEKFVRKEYKQKSFSRSFTIDENIDAETISAKYVNGVLTLNLAKKQEVEPSVKEISIQ
jgi:HSP20 family protein